MVTGRQGGHRLRAGRGSKGNPGLADQSLSDPEEPGQPTQGSGFHQRAVPLRLRQHFEQEDSDEVYERYHIPAPGSFVRAGPLANFTPGHQDTYVNFRNEDRAPLLFIAGGRTTSCLQR